MGRSPPNLDRLGAAYQPVERGLVEAEDDVAAKVDHRYAARALAGRMRLALHLCVGLRVPLDVLLHEGHVARAQVGGRSLARTAPRSFVDGDVAARQGLVD